jgi:hypothetical protein
MDDGGDLHEQILHWGDCGCDRRDGRFWLKHEHFEANYDRHESRQDTQDRVDQQKWILRWWEMGRSRTERGGIKRVGTRTRRRDCLSHGQHGQQKIGLVLPAGMKRVRWLLTLHDVELAANSQRVSES